jgi:hypothetical protein
MDRMLFETRRHLLNDDLGDEIEPGFFMKDLGRVEDSSPGPAVQAEKISRPAKQRAEREKIAEQMAAQLMDYYMAPATLNDPHILNPIRDGIPQCTKHRFVAGSSKEIGCIYGCGPSERDSAGNLPVARDGTLGDAWNWVRALVVHAVLTQDKRLKF